MSVKVLLVNDIEKLGFFGDVIEVKEGYARNYLLPQGLAIIPTEGNLRSLEEEKQKRAELRKSLRKQLEDSAEALEGAEVVVAATTNEQGHLFGSVGPAEIATNLREQGLLADKPSEDKTHAIAFEEGLLKVADEVIKLDERIKQVGTSQATVKLADDLSVAINVVVVSENHNIVSVETENSEPGEANKSDDQDSQQEQVENSENDKQSEAEEQS
jgi:large subunit ribosomal protein L9